MRTMADEQRLGAAPHADVREPLPQAGGNGSRNARATHSGQAASASIADGGNGLSVYATTLHLDAGLHVVEISDLGEPLGMLQNLELPAIHLAPVPGDEDRGVAIVANSAGAGPWLALDGGTVVVQAPSEGGDLLVTVYAPGDATCPIPRIVARRLDRGRPLDAAGRAEAFRHPAPRIIPTEVVLHIHRVGDRRFVGEGWFGVRGQRLHVEAFSIRPLDSLAAVDVEFMGFGPGNRQTPWVTDGRLCGTRGRALPLTGFAIRLSPQAQSRFDVSYEGAFIESGVVGPIRNGEPCVPPVADDPLEAINVRITERPGGSG